jgi:hypothetical protein
VITFSSGLLERGDSFPFSERVDLPLVGLPPPSRGDLSEGTLVGVGRAAGGATPMLFLPLLFLSWASSRSRSTSASLQSTDFQSQNRLILTRGRGRTGSL